MRSATNPRRRLADDLPFALIDTFTQRPLSGNPLAVVFMDIPRSVQTMRRVAREFNQSETTFVLPPAGEVADWRLRSFTPMGVEIFGAGHNSMGAWWSLAERGTLSLTARTNRLYQELGGDVLPVDIRAHRGRPTLVTLTQAPPVAGRAPGDLRKLARALGVTVDDFATSRLPLQVVSTGDAHLLVSLVNRDAVDRVHADAELLFEIMQHLHCEGCYVFSLEPADADVHAYARFLNPTGGLIEDPASGGAAGPLACHLHAHGLVEAGKDVLVEQGTALGRRSVIRAQVTSRSVEVSGHCVTVAEGWLRI